MLLAACVWREFMPACPALFLFHLLQPAMLLYVQASTLPSCHLATCFDVMQEALIHHGRMKQGEKGRKTNNKQMQRRKKRRKQTRRKQKAPALLDSHTPFC